jgi:hypothetical protein
MQHISEISSRQIDKTPSKIPKLATKNSQKSMSRNDESFRESKIP